jgi:hypothetical protein
MEDTLDTIIIQWKGPYLDAQNIGGKEGYGLYLLAGKIKFGRNIDIQYCGITERTYKERFFEHQKSKLTEINREQEIWIGNISFPRRIQVRSATANGGLV